MQDQASLNNGDATGATDCGERVYELVGGGIFLTIDSSKRELILQTDSDTDAGYHYPSMRVSLRDYPTVTLDIALTVVIASCSVTGIKDPSGVVVSPYIVAMGMPVDLEIDAPKFVPYALCGYSAGDVEYQVLEAGGGKVDDWIEYDRG